MGFTSGGYMMQRGLGWAQLRKSETVASRLSHCDHLYGNCFFQPSGLSPSCASSRSNPDIGMYKIALECQAAGDFDSLGVHPAILVREKSGDRWPDEVGRLHLTHGENWRQSPPYTKRPPKRKNAKRIMSDLAPPFR